jgi:uncharacterized protein involved in outer membrane biogenesis
MKKVLLGLFGLILVVLVGGFLYVYLNLNGLVKGAVEEFAPRYTQTDVSLGSVNLSLSGEGSLSDLVIGNPKGYKGDQSLSLGKLEVALDPASLTKDVIVIHKLAIVAPGITYEPGGKAGSNLQQLVKNIQDSTRSSGGETQAASAGDKPAKGKKVIIDRLVISDGKVSVVTPLSQQPLSAGLPTIEFADIGRDKGGEYIPVVIKQVIQKVTESARKVANVSLDDLKAQLKGKVDEKVKETVDKLPGGVQEQLGDGVGDKLKNLFGN